MRRVGIFYAYWEENWQVDFLPYVTKVKNLGYEQLEVHGCALEAMGRDSRLRLAATAADNDIVLSYGMGLAATVDPSSLDEQIRRRGVAEMTKIIGFVAEMGGGQISGSVESYWPAQLPMGVTDKRPYLSQCLKSMKELATVAEDNAVGLNIEVLNRFEHFLFNTSAEARAFVDQVNSPAVGILLDTFHMNIEEDSFAEAILTAGPYLKSFHLGENNRKPITAATRLPLAAIKEALDKINYQGPLVQEPFVRPGGEVGYNIRVYRELLPLAEMDRAAADSARYIKETLR